MTKSQQKELLKKAAEELECMVDILNRMQQGEEGYNYNTCYELLKLATEI